MYNPLKSKNHPLSAPPVNPLWDWEEEMRTRLAKLTIRGERTDPEFRGVFSHQSSLLARWQLLEDYWIDIPWPNEDVFLIRGRKFVMAARLYGEINEVKLITPARTYANIVGSHVSWVSRSRKKLDLSDTFVKVYTKISKLSVFQLLDDTNKTSANSHKHRVYNPSKKTRDIVQEFRGRLCPIETPESTKIGLTLHLAKDAKVKRDTGEVLAPFLIDGQVQYLSAEEERKIQGDLGGLLPLAWPDALFSRATAQVPLIHVNDPNRVLMGTNHIKQALPLKVGEAPIIRTGYELENYGVNLLVAYTHVHGITYEDAVVISESAAKKLTAVSRKTIESTITRREILIPDHYQLPHLDVDGIVKEGYYVREYDVLVAKARRLDSSDVVHLLNLPNLEGYAPSSTVVPRFTQGVVDQVEVIDKPRKHLKKIILIRLKRELPASEGDKLSGRYGNKGVIGRILPDDKMPRLPDGRPVEMVISPSSVISRMNLGQLLETQLTWVLKEYGEKDHGALDIIKETLGGSLAADSDKLYIEAEHFGGVQVKTLIELQEKLGIPDKVSLYDPVENRGLGDAVVGYQYILRLNHIASDKLSGRATGPLDYMDMPTGGRAKKGGQRIGEMEGWALKAHGAAHLYRELRAIRSDSYGGKVKAGFDIEDGKPIHIHDYDGLTGVSVSFFMTALAASGLKVSIKEKEE